MPINWHLFSCVFIMIHLLLFDTFVKTIQVEWGVTVRTKESDTTRTTTRLSIGNLPKKKLISSEILQSN